MVVIGTRELFYRYFKPGRRRSLRRVLFVCLFGTQVTSLLLALGFSFINSERAIRKQSDDLVLDRFQAVINDVSALVTTAEKTTVFLSQLLETRAVLLDDDLGVEKSLYGVLRTAPSLSSAYILRADGSYVKVGRSAGQEAFHSRVYQPDAAQLVVTYRDSMFRPRQRVARIPKPIEHDFFYPISNHPRDLGRQRWTETATFVGAGTRGLAVTFPVFFESEMVGQVGVEIPLTQVQEVLDANSGGLDQIVAILTLEGDTILQSRDEFHYDPKLLQLLANSTIQSAHEMSQSGGIVRIKDDLSEGNAGAQRNYLTHVEEFPVPGLRWLLAIHVLDLDLLKDSREGQKRLLWFAAFGLILLFPLPILVSKQVHGPLIDFSDKARKIISSEHEEQSDFVAPYKELESTTNVLVEEISQRRNYQAAYERTFDVSSRGMARIDLPALRFIHVNDQLEEMFGRTRQHLLQNSIQSIVGFDHRTDLEKFLIAYESDKEYSFSFKFQKDGSQDVWIKASTLTIRDHNGAPNHALMIFDDISETHRANEELDKLKQELLQVGGVNMLGQFAAGLAHELNQPLGAMLHDVDSAQLLLKNTNFRHVELAEILKDIDRNTKRAGEIIRALRDMIGKESGRTEPFLLLELLTQIKIIMEPEVKKLGAHISVQIEPNVQIWSNRNQIAQVLINLIRNSMEAAESYNITSCTVRIFSESKGNKAILRVEDNGPGIPDNIQPFTLFDTNRPEGMGLGLSICRSLVEGNGGSICYQRLKPRGAGFVIELPIGSSEIQGEVNEQ